MKLLAGLAELILRHTRYVYACIFLDGLEDREAAERRLEVHLVLSDCHL